MTYLPSNIPTTPSGVLAAAEAVPKATLNGPYGFKDSVRTINSATGATSTETGSFKLNTGTDTAGFASVFSAEASIYSPGNTHEAIIDVRFIIGTPTTGNFSMRAGLLNATDAAVIEQDETGIGVAIYSSGGQANFACTIDTQGNASDTIVLTIDTDVYTYTAAAGTAEEQAKAAAEYFSSNVPNWLFQAIGSKFVGRNLFATSVNTLTLGSTGVFVITANTYVGTAPNKAKYNFSSLDMPADFDEAKLNKYKIELDAIGAVKFYVFSHTTGNLELFYAADTSTILGSGFTYTATDFRVGWTAANLGNDTDLTMYGTYAVASSIGVPSSIKHTHVVSGSFAAVDTNWTKLFNVATKELRVEAVKEAVNIASVYLTELQLSNDNNVLVEIGIFKDVEPDPAGIFQLVDGDSSLIIADTESTGELVTTGTLIVSYTCPKLGGIINDLSKLALQMLPGQVYTIAVRSTGASAALTGSLLLEEFI